MVVGHGTITPVVAGIVLPGVITIDFEVVGVLEMDKKPRL
jgi:hypothetical protein